MKRGLKKRVGYHHRCGAQSVRASARLSRSGSLVVTSTTLDMSKALPEGAGPPLTKLGLWVPPSAHRVLLSALLWQHYRPWRVLDVRLSEVCERAGVVPLREVDLEAVKTLDAGEVSSLLLVVIEERYLGGTGAPYLLGEVCAGLHLPHLVSATRGAPPGSYLGWAGIRPDETDYLITAVAPCATLDG